MKRLSILCCVLGLILTVSCADESDPVGTPALFVRAHNLSTTAFSSLVLDFRDGRQEVYGALAANEETRFREVDEAYPVVGVTIEAEGEVYQFTPADYSIYDPLDVGNYTYELELDVDQNSVIVTLVTEE